MKRSWEICRALVLVGLSSLPIRFAMAADTPADATPDADSLSEVVVTATHREENEKDVPVSLSVLAGDSLQALGDSGDDIKQLAFRVPSLNIESSNGRAFPRFYIRGYGNTDFHDFASQPVGLYYDDIVQENAALKGFPIFDQQDVEVLRGPQGTLFGRNSPAGVVKLESARPELGITSGSFSMSDGTFNSAVLQGVVNLPLSDVVAMRVSTQVQHRDDWVNDSINDTKVGGYNDFAGRVQILFKPSDEFSALVNFHGRSLDGSSTLFRANIIGYGTNKLIPGFDPGEIYTDGPNSSTLGTIGGNLHLTLNLPGITLQSITGYESVQKYLAEGDIDGGYGPGYFSVLPQPSGPGPIPFPVQTSAGLAHHSQWTQEFRALTNGTGPLQAQVGAFFFFENVTAVDDDYCTPGSIINNCQNQQLWTLQDTTASQQKNDAEAIFGSVDYSVTDAFKATAGVRLTQDHKDFATLYSNTDPLPTPPLNADATATNVSWDVSGDYALTKEVSFYARVATGFRAPSFGEPAAGLPIQVARSEKNISYETGVKADLFDHKARVSWDVYYYDVKGQQLTAVGGSTNVAILLNAQKTVGKGSELDFEFHPVSFVTFNLSGSYNGTRIEDPNLGIATCTSGAGGYCHVTDPFFQTGPQTGLAELNGNPLPEAAKWVGDMGLRVEQSVPGGNVYAYTDMSTRSQMNALLYTAQEFTLAPLTQVGLRLGYSWAADKYDVAVFCRNCTNQIRTIGVIDFDNRTGYINDPRVFAAQFRAKF